MSDKVFYVRALDKEGKPGAYVPARVMTINGQPVVDPTLGDRLKPTPYVFSDQDGYNSDTANPNNYMIVPANFDEAQARAYADQIAKIQSSPFGTPFAWAKMAHDFLPGGSQDLQRHPQWGIPDGSIVPAFISAASHYLGFVSELNDIPLGPIELAGGRTNRGVDRSGPYGVSQQNHKNLVLGRSDAMRPPDWAANNFDYSAQIQGSNGRIGDGMGQGWISSLYGIDPQNPTQPAGPQRPSGPLGLVSNQPMPDWPFPPPIFNTR
jgi:hypothetical protein